MIIKFVKNLGKYKTGMVHKCKTDLDTTKAKELVKWGFAQEIDATTGQPVETKNKKVKSKRGLRKSRFEIVKQSKKQDKKREVEPAAPVAAISQKKLRQRIKNLRAERMFLKEKVGKIKQDRKKAIRLLENNMRNLNDQLRGENRIYEDRDALVDFLGQVKEKLQNLDIRIGAYNTEIKGRDEEKQALKDALENFQKEKQNEQEILREEIEEEKQRIKDLKEQINLFRDKLEAKSRKKDQDLISFEKKLLSLGRKLKKKDQEKSALEDKARELELEKQAEAQKMQSLEEKQEEWMKKIKKEEKERDEANSLFGEEKESLEQQLVQKDKQIESLGKEIRGLQILETFESEKQKRDQASQEEKILNLEQKVSEMEEEKEKTLGLFRENLDILEEQLEKKDSQLDKQDSQVTLLNKELERLRREQIKTMEIEKKQQVEREKEQLELEKKIDEYEKTRQSKIRSLEQNVDSLKEELKSKDRQLANYDRRVKEILTRQERGDGNIQKQRENSEELVRDFSGEMVVDQEDGENN
ncbi:hypothetical protein KJ912_03705 [Patescibacteria group bacterium]|nr:hypothetical protein [Patescibacteria group bacterium]